jgi:condensin complex subunit 1
LLTALLEHNPFLGSLDPKPYQMKLKECYEAIKLNLPNDLKKALENSFAIEIDKSGLPQQVEQAILAAAISEADALDNLDEITPAQIDFRSNVRALRFAQAALDFIGKCEYASEACQSMLLSSNTSDVTEALRFFVRARTFQLPCAMTGMKHALTLLWSTEQSVRDEVLAAFVEVFISVPGTEGKQYLPVDQIAQNLLLLVSKASVSELASIEEAVGKLVANERIPAEVFLILWSITSKANGNVRSAALSIIAMAASADRSIVDSASRLKILLDAGLGDDTETQRDWNTAKAAAEALQRISIVKMDPTCAKAIVLEQIIIRLSAIIRGDWCVDDRVEDTQAWFSAAEKSIDALFTVSQEAEIDCANIIRSMTEAVFGINKTMKRQECHSLCLARFFFVLGHVALKLLVYTEYLSGAIRRGNAKKSLRKQECADKQLKAEDGKIADSIEAELGVAAEIEAENERRFADIAEKEILGRGLISKFTPLVVRVVANEGGKFQSEILRQSASLALSKFMCISLSFCEDHLPLMFTALANSPESDTILRANAVVALGDHAFRFPNEVEPYTPRIYACLRDPSTKVRRHTLMVLTHLILNDMVKVKGQVCEIAMSLRDEDPRIVDMSRLLFFELSKRTNNPIYNLLPDIISKLSNQTIKQEDFRMIMVFLLGFIKKDKQHEMLVEKLLHRIPKCECISQKADIAFCIAQLKVNERSIKIMIELFRVFKDALYDEEVKKCFLSIVMKAKKTMKSDMKLCLEEFESKLSEYSLIGQENQAVGEKAKRAKKKAVRRAAKRNKKLEAVEELSCSDDDGSEGIFKENNVLNGRRSSNRRRDLDV